MENDRTDPISRDAILSITHLASITSVESPRMPEGGIPVRTIPIWRARAVGAAARPRSAAGRVITSQLAPPRRHAAPADYAGQGLPKTNQPPISRKNDRTKPISQRRILVSRFAAHRTSRELAAGFQSRDRAERTQFGDSGPWEVHPARSSRRPKPTGAPRARNKTRARLSRWGLLARCWGPYNRFAG